MATKARTFRMKTANASFLPAFEDMTPVQYVNYIIRRDAVRRHALNVINLSKNKDLMVFNLNIGQSDVKMTSATGRNRSCSGKLVKVTSTESGIAKWPYE